MLVVFIVSQPAFMYKADILNKKSINLPIRVLSSKYLLFFINYLNFNSLYYSLTSNIIGSSSSVAEQELVELQTRVRFSSIALLKEARI